MSDELLWEAVTDATRATHDVLAELARDAAGAVAFVGRTALSRDFVVLKLEPERSLPGEEARFHLAEIRELDETVPAPRTQCAVCAAAVASWRGQCPACGAPIGAGGGGAGGTISAEALLAFYQLATTDYEVLGELQQARGGPPVYVAKVRGDDVLLALRLTQAGMQAGPQPGYFVDLLPLRGRGAPPAPAPRRVPLEIAPLSDRSGAATRASDRVCPRCGTRFGPDILFCPRDGSSLQPLVTGDDLVGQLIDDRYFVEKRLGEGGMGEVYIAQQVRTGRKCALKLMHRSLTQDVDAVGRFHREAASACAISHANVATIYDSGKTSDGRPYFAMEFVEGRSLSQVIRSEGPLAADRAADIGRQIADGLAAAHDLEIVHRDLKPDNVMLGATRAGDEVVKLVDFGIAKPTNHETRGITRTGFILGTPQYMSPEQLRGDPLDGRTDLYSLGCVIYEMLTGVVPFDGETTELVMMRRLTEPAPRPRKRNETVPRVLDDVVGRLLAREPDDRYADAREVSAALAAARAGMMEGGGLPFGLSNWLGKRTPAAPAPSARARSRRITVTTDPRPARTSLDPVPTAPLSPAIPVRAATPTRVAAAHSASGAAMASAADSSAPLRSAAAGSALTRAPRTAGHGARVGRPAAAPVRRARKRQRLLSGAAGILVVAGAALATMNAVHRASGNRRDTARAAASPRAAAPASVAPSYTSEHAGAATTDVVPTGSTVPSPTPMPGPEHRSAAATAGRRSTATTVGPSTTSSASGRDAPPPTARPNAAPDIGQRALPTTSVPPYASPGPTTPRPAASDSGTRKPDVAVTAGPGYAGHGESSAADLERAEVEHVRATIQRYVQAINDKELGQIQRLYPALAQNAREGLQTLFSQASDFAATLSSIGGISVHGATADASFTYELRGHSPSMGNFKRPFSVQATLQRTQDGWKFQSIAGRR